MLALKEPIGSVASTTLDKRPVDSIAVKPALILVFISSAAQRDHKLDEHDHGEDSSHHSDRISDELLKSFVTAPVI